MSKVDFEYYPHIVDNIWKHISDPRTVYAAGQVCSSWRKRALATIYRHLSANTGLGGWNLWMKTDGKDIHLKYLVPATRAGMLLGSSTTWTGAPGLDEDIAARHTEILDVDWTSASMPADAAVKLAAKLTKLHTMRVHTGDHGDLEGIGMTQVYSWFSRETPWITVIAHKAKTLVLLITVERPVVVDGLFDDEVRLSRQLLKESYAASDLVLVFRPYEVVPRFTSKTLARDVAYYIGVTCASFRITVVGAETLLRDEVGGPYENFKAAALRQLAARNPEHGVRFMTHEEYEAAVGPETYGLHCVPDAHWR